MAVNKRISAFFCVAASLLLIVIIITSQLHLQGAEGRPELFINDRPWYNSAKYPLEVIDGIIYIPATAFAELSNIIMNSNKDLDVFYIDNITAGKYISFDRNNDYAFVNDSDLIKNVKTYLNGEVFYIPLNFVSSAIDVTVTQYKSTTANTTYYRISNGSQKLSFSELLKLYKPSALNPSDTSTVTTPKVTTDTTTAPPVTTTTDSGSENPDPVFVYLTFSGIPSEDSEIFTLLKKNNVPAAFFVDGNDMKENVGGLFRIIYEGYTVVLTDDKNALSEDLSQFLEYINSANDVLARITKNKTHIASKYGGCDGGSFKLNKADILELSKNGYVIWDVNIDAQNGTSGKAVFNTVKKNLNKYQSPVISLGTDEKAADALKRLIDYFNDSTYYIFTDLNLYNSEINGLADGE